MGGAMNYTRETIQNMAIAALWIDDEDIAGKLEDSGDGLMSFYMESIEGVVWVTIATPILGQLAAYPVDDLLARFTI